MNVSGGLIRLYPRPFRARWGYDLQAEADSSGARSWPGLLKGILDAWVHPAIWPADTGSQRRNRTITLGAAVVSAGWLLGHALLELDSLVPRRIAHSWILNACDALTVLGFALLLPRPRLRADVLLTIITGAARKLAIPALACSGVVLLANSRAVPNAASLLDPMILACWWGSLAAGAVQVCRVIAGLNQTLAVPPPRRQLRAGMWILATGLGSTTILLLCVGGDSGDPLSIAAAAGLLGLTIACISATRDLPA